MVPGEKVLDAAVALKRSQVVFFRDNQSIMIPSFLSLCTLVPCCLILVR